MQYFAMRLAGVVGVILLALGLSSCRRKAPRPAIPAAPRSANIVMVLDRSGSLKASGSCSAVIDAATGLVNLFAGGSNRIGLVSFATTTYVNFPVSQAFLTADPSLPKILSRIECAGSTATATALWAGYQQLIAASQPEGLNAIVFFTDGTPTGATFDMPIAASSSCSESTPGSPAGADAYSMPGAGKGYIRGVYTSFVAGVSWAGLFDPQGSAGSDGIQMISNNDVRPAPHSAGCSYAQGWPPDGGMGNVLSTSDFLGVPTKDIYGNSTNSSDHPVTLNPYGFVDLANPQNGLAVAGNVADSAAANIRSGAVDPVSGKGLPGVIIYSIGLIGSAPLSGATFLDRLSNSSSSPVHDPGKRTGKVVYAASGGELGAAFRSVASEILGSIGK